MTAEQPEKTLRDLRQTAIEAIDEMVVIAGKRIAAGAAFAQKFYREQFDKTASEMFSPSVTDDRDEIRVLTDGLEHLRRNESTSDMARDSHHLRMTMGKAIKTTWAGARERETLCDRIVTAARRLGFSGVEIAEWLLALERKATGVAPDVHHWITDAKDVAKLQAAVTVESDRANLHMEYLLAERATVAPLRRDLKQAIGERDLARSALRVEHARADDLQKSIDAAEALRKSSDRHAIALQRLIEALDGGRDPGHALDAKRDAPHHTEKAKRVHERIANLEARQLREVRGPDGSRCLTGTVGGVEVKAWIEPEPAGLTEVNVQPSSGPGWPLRSFTSFVPRDRIKGDPQPGEPVILKPRFHEGELGAHDHELYRRTVGERIEAAFVGIDDRLWLVLSGGAALCIKVVSMSRADAAEVEAERRNVAEDVKTRLAERAKFTEESNRNEMDRLRDVGINPVGDK